VSPATFSLEAIESLTFDELDDLEAATGEPFGQIISRMGQGIDGLSAKTLRAFLWLLERRDDPDVTLEEMGARPALAGLVEAGAEMAKKGAIPTNGIG
jgi:hypothetical protein